MPSINIVHTRAFSPDHDAEPRHSPLQELVTPNAAIADSMPEVAPNDSERRSSQTVYWPASASQIRISSLPSSGDEQALETLDVASLLTTVVATSSVSSPTPTQVVDATRSSSRVVMTSATPRPSTSPGAISVDLQACIEATTRSRVHLRAVCIGLAGALVGVVLLVYCVRWCCQRRTRRRRESLSSARSQKCGSTGASGLGFADVESQTRETGHYRESLSSYALQAGPQNPGNAGPSGSGSADADADAKFQTREIRYHRELLPSHALQARPQQTGSTGPSGLRSADAEFQTRETGYHRELLPSHALQARPQQTGSTGPSALQAPCGGARPLDTGIQSVVGENRPAAGENSVAPSDLGERSRRDSGIRTGPQRRRVGSSRSLGVANCDNISDLQDQMSVMGARIEYMEKHMVQQDEAIDIEPPAYEAEPSPSSSPLDVVPRSPRTEPVNHDQRTREAGAP
ncbi:hypothetical protein NEOLEDRAFT_308954 [Neolentinus lepideus HHB14362 ss-1]|uniref:Uncharacterized protein n=1 Tax=Neolentinus lepideus HHB14362 ss-1 TaxID=1314782 RepID=A0A165VS86_9AGAM|nr:hypothetical protein NEOLEDRAFT_308954 [Neolentinus lepideus HHB14362 ss-1]